MSSFAIAATAQEAAHPGAPSATTAEAAASKAGGAVFLTSEELPGAFADLASAEAAYPDLYGSGRFEAIWRDEAWRVLIRFWRRSPPAPVARTPSAAHRKPLGHARTPDEASIILGQTAELGRAPLPRLYRTMARARAVWRAALDSNLADLVEVDGGFQVWLSFWRPVAPAPHAAHLAPGERTELEARKLAPLRPRLPQADPNFGLFETPAPENPAIVLAEEGDGRTRGE
jgi:hypothetical protein